LSNVLEVLERRGFIYQITAPSAEEKSRLQALLQGQVTCYIGFDPTASSLHVGSLVPIMSLVHMQHHGHRPIALVGGGTGLIGDPSGKTEMRKLLTRGEINQNAEGIKKQLSNFIDFRENQAVILNNADWLTTLKYIDVLRDIGRHFSVNRMLTAESIRQGLERGLSFIEFNYMVLQAYDFWHLFTHHDCLIQMGGSDQWGNIVAGIELIRRLENRQAYGITFPLLETSSGRKMGKTEQGTIWLDPVQTPAYDYFQFWVNTEDPDVLSFLKLFTLLPLDEINQLESLEGADLNPIKAVLAYEATKIARGEDAALKAFQDSTVFGTKEIPRDLLPSSSVPRVMKTGDLPSMPTTLIHETRLEEGVPAYELFSEVGLCRTRGEARRLIAQGGAYCNERRIELVDERIGKDDLRMGGILLRKGKKRYHRILPDL
jgi:tyrosyl-tRNA synthetase